MKKHRDLFLSQCLPIRSAGIKIGLFSLALLLQSFISISAQQVSGTVKDEKNEPLIGVTVQIKGTQNGTITDMDGHYELSKINENSTLVFSYVGYVSKEVKVTSSIINVTLSENLQALSDVVVIGYGTARRKDVTTAISSVSTGDIDQRPITSAAQAIQGKAAGVTVVKPNGQPGADMVIRVRGTTSMNGSNDPLYVVDGVPMTNIDFLSSNDIESMQILKDASSAAIYGSRAANGVIMITTKASLANNEKTKISFNAYGGITNVAKKMESLNTAQYREYLSDLGSSVVLPDGLTDQTDWFDETYSTGQQQNYQLSVSGGTKKTNYYISGGYQNEVGIIKTTSFTRYNFRSNVSSQLTKWLKMSTDITYSNYINKGGIGSGTGSNRGGLVLSVINTPKYAPIWDPDNPGQYYTNFYGISNITSPLENMARYANQKTRNHRLLLTGKAEASLTKDLKYTNTFTDDILYTHYTYFLDPTTTSYGRSEYGEGTDNRSFDQVLIWDNVINYKHQFGKHGLDGMIGSSWTTSDWSQTYQTATNYADGTVETLNAANKLSNSNGTTASQWAIMSYVGRISYNYDSRYIITANMRADGSSKLAPKHRWGYFPSFSAAWRISSEDFMQGLDWLNDFKLRGGWGQTGNQTGLGDYGYLLKYDYSRVDWWEEGNSNAVPTIYQSSLRNSDLTWETTSQTDIGFDLTLLNNRLTLNSDYYYKYTTNMLMDVTLPSGAAAVSSITRNEGEMENKGVEFSLSSHNLVGKFKWNTDFNISHNKNKLTKLGLTKVYYDAQVTDILSDYIVRNTPGKPLGSFYGYISDGVDPETGKLKYRDINGDGVITASDRTYIGDPNPLFTYGMTNTFSYKNFTLSIMLQGSYGNDIFNVSRIETEGMYDAKNQSTAVLKRWRIPGQITDMPKAGYNMKLSSYFIEDGSYMRIKDVTLSYNVDGKWMNKLGISSLQPYFTASNLLTFTKYSGMDPEVNQYGNSGTVQGVDYGTYPQTRSYIIGVNIDF